MSTGSQQHETAKVVDVGPTVNQRWANVSCLSLYRGSMLNGCVEINVMNRALGHLCSHIG